MGTMAVRYQYCHGMYMDWANVKKSSAEFVNIIGSSDDTFLFETSNHGPKLRVTLQAMAINLLLSLETFYTEMHGDVALELLFLLKMSLKMA